MKLSLRIGAVSAFTLIGFLAAPGPARAACFGTNGANTCSVFHPETSSSIVDTGGFVGMGMSGYDKVKVKFATNGQWQNPFTISGITLKGDGITTSLNFGSLTITPSLTWGANDTGYINLDTSITDLNQANNMLSFVIPSGVANITGNYSSISARLTYADAGDDNMVTTPSNNRVQSTAINTVPSPLPFLGATSAFAFSRRLRQRMRQAT